MKDGFVQAMAVILGGIEFLVAPNCCSNSKSLILCQYIVADAENPTVFVGHISAETASLLRIRGEWREHFPQNTLTFLRETGKVYAQSRAEVDAVFEILQIIVA